MCFNNDSGNNWMDSEGEDDDSEYSQLEFSIIDPLAIAQEELNPLNYSLTTLFIINKGKQITKSVTCFPSIPIPLRSANHISEQIFTSYLFPFSLCRLSNKREYYLESGTFFGISTSFFIKELLVINEGTHFNQSDYGIYSRMNI